MGLLDEVRRAKGGFSTEPDQAELESTVLNADTPALISEPGTTPAAPKVLFSEAFASARKAGAPTFTWEGGEYTTQTKEEADAAKPAVRPTQSADIEAKQPTDSGLDMFGNPKEAPARASVVDTVNPKVDQRLFKEKGFEAASRDLRGKQNEIGAGADKAYAADKALAKKPLINLQPGAATEDVNAWIAHREAQLYVDNPGGDPAFRRDKAIADFRTAHPSGAFDSALDFAKSATSTVLDTAAGAAKIGVLLDDSPGLALKKIGRGTANLLNYLNPGKHLGEDDGSHDVATKLFNKAFGSTEDEAGQMQEALERIENGVVSGFVQRAADMTSGVAANIAEDASNETKGDRIALSEADGFLENMIGAVENGPDFFGQVAGSMGPTVAVSRAIMKSAVRDAAKTANSTMAAVSSQLATSERTLSAAAKAAKVEAAGKQAFRDSMAAATKRATSVAMRTEAVTAGAMATTANERALLETLASGARPPEYTTFVLAAAPPGYAEQGARVMDGTATDTEVDEYAVTTQRLQKAWAVSSAMEAAATNMVGTYAASRMLGGMAETAMVKALTPKTTGIGAEAATLKQRAVQAAGVPVKEAAEESLQSVTGEHPADVRMWELTGRKGAKPDLAASLGQAVVGGVAGGGGVVVAGAALNSTGASIDYAKAMLEERTQSQAWREVLQRERGITPEMLDQAEALRPAYKAAREAGDQAKVAEITRQVEKLLKPGAAIMPHMGNTTEEPRDTAADIAVGDAVEQALAAQQAVEQEQQFIDEQQAAEQQDLEAQIQIEQRDPVESAGRSDPTFSVNVAVEEDPVSPELDVRSPQVRMAQDQADVEATPSLKNKVQTLDIAQLPATGKAVNINDIDQDQALRIEMILGALYGVRPVFYRGNLESDGFKLPNDSLRRVFIKAEGATVAPEFIVGHEFFHEVEEADPKNAVAAHMAVLFGAGPKGVRNFKVATDYNDQEAPSEMAADLSGGMHSPLFTKTKFFDRVFADVKKEHGAAKGKVLIKNFIQAVGHRHAELRSRIEGNIPGYGTEKFLSDVGLTAAFNAIGEAVRNYTPGVVGELDRAQAGKDMGVRFTKTRKPGSDIGHKRHSTDGRYVGAPDWVGNSPQSLGALRNTLRQLTHEGTQGRYWYERSSKAVLDLVGGDKIEAEKFVALLAIYSQSTGVATNTHFALEAYYQWKAGLPIRSGRFPTAQSKKAANIVLRDEGWSGIKTNNFYADLMTEIDPSKVDEEHSTMDMWMAIAFDYGSDKLDQGPKYLFAQREIKRLADEMGWKPHQVQAAIWTAIKARVEFTEKKRNKIEILKGIRVKGGTAKGREYEHFRLAHKLGMESNITQAQIDASNFDFGHALEQRTVQMSWEATPSKESGVLPGIHNATYQQKFEYLTAIAAAIHGKDGRDLIAEMVGMGQGVEMNGFSAWEGDIGAGGQSFYGAPIVGAKQKRAVTPGARDVLNRYAAVKGYVLSQNAVIWHAPVFDDSKIRHNGFHLETVAPIGQDEMAMVYNGIIAQFNTTELAPAWRPNGFRVLNFKTGLSNTEFQKGMRDVIAALPELGGGSQGHMGFRADSEYVGNNWSEDKNGEKYRDRINAGSPDLLGRADELRAVVARVNERFAKKYGWGGTVKRSLGRDGGGRYSSRGLAALEGAPAVRGFSGPDPRLVEVAERYAQDNGVDLQRQETYAKVDEARAGRIAAAYEAMPHAPNDPKVREAYENLVRQTTAQYQALVDAGYQFWFTDTNLADNAEYLSSPWNAMRDIRANQTMGVYPTDDGFGSSDFDPAANPLLADTGFEWPVGGPNGMGTKRVLANDLFRAVHDAFGHGLEGAGFRAEGEENAWQAHVRLFTGSAIGAITSETRGQNSWLNYGPHGEANRSAQVEDTVFADQKTGLMPEWTWTEGLVAPAPVTKFSKPRLKDANGQDLVVYHGGPENFGRDGNTAVRGEANGYRPFFTSPDRELATDYARGGHVAALHLRAYPIDLTTGSPYIEELLKIYNTDQDMLGNNPDAAWDVDEDGPFTGNEYLLANSPAVIDRIRALGYDAMKFNERPGVVSYATFSPDQVELVPGIPTAVVSPDDAADVPNALYADFGNEAYIVFAQRKDGQIALLSMASAEDVRGRDMLRWLNDAYGRRVRAYEVAYSATGFWEKMEDEGRISGWTQNELTAATVPVTKIKRNANIRRSVNRKDHAWKSMLKTQNGPLFEGDGFVLAPVRAVPHETDFDDGGMAALGVGGHTAFVAEGATPYIFAIMSGGEKTGHLLADVKGNEIVTIHDLEVYTKQSGLGSKLVAHIAANTQGPVRVIDALKQAEPFWEKLGVQELDQYRNGTLDWAGAEPYLSARQGRPEAGSGGVSADAGSPGTDGYTVEYLDPADAAGLRFSDGRPNEASGRGVREDADGTDGRNVQGHATQVIGVHYSQHPRDVLDSSKYGSGLPGHEAQRLSDWSATPEQQHRIYFYVDEGVGIAPESGVGPHPHPIKLNNLYPAKQDPLKLRPVAARKSPTEALSGNFFEQAAMAAGFDGIYYQGAFGNQGGAVLLGPRMIKVKKSKNRQIDTPEFKSWFGDSKVVDENGAPRVVYHGTTRDITRFKQSRTGMLGGGIYFTGSTDDANRYATGEGANIVPVYLSIKNPATNEDIRRMGEIPEAQMKGYLEVRGFDGIDYTDEYGTVFVAFSPKQIKSAIGNNGDFNPATPDIRHSVNRAKVDAIKAMTPDERDNLDVYDYGFKEYMVYEAETMMPKKEGTMKMVNENNSFALWQEADAVVNVGGEAYLATKQEDPDDDNDEGLYVWQFNDPTNTTAAGFTSSFSDKTEAIDEFRDNLHVIGEQAAPVKFSVNRQTDTPEFKKWFGDSKVVDENGAPRVVYHGTDAAFAEFKKGQNVNFANAQRLLGFFFAEDEQYAGQYGKNVMPVFLNIRNPFIAPASRIDAIENASDRNARAWAKRLRDQGFDGIRFGEGVTAEWVAFQPTQIKSAIGNNGDFNPATPDIRKSVNRKVKFSVDRDTVAENALRKLNLGILSEEELSTYNDHRFDKGDLRPEAPVERLVWEHYSGMSKKQFYVRDPEGVAVGLLRTAWFYPEGTDESTGVPVMVIEDEHGREVAEHLFEQEAKPVKFSRPKKTPEQLRADHARMIGQDDERLVSHLEQAMAETEADFIARKRGVVSHEETDAAADALARRLHWDVEEVTAALARGTVEIGTDDEPLSIPAADLLGASATTVRIALAELLDNPQGPDFTKRMASVINLMVATRANLSEIGRALNYAGRLQRKPFDMPASEHTEQLKKATQDVLDSADAIIGVHGGDEQAEQAITRAWNEAQRTIADARQDVGTALEETEQAQAELDELRQATRDALSARDVAKKGLREAEADLRKEEQRRADAVGRTPSSFEITQAEGEARRAENEARAARDWEKLVSERLRGAQNRLARAQERLQNARDNQTNPEELKQAEQKARLAEAEALLADKARRDAAQKMRDAERDLKKAQEREAAAIAKMPSAPDITAAQVAAREAQEQSDEAVSRLRQALRDLSKAKARLKGMQARRDKAIDRLNGVEAQVKELREPQYLGKGGVSMEEIEAYVGGPKGMARIQRAMAEHRDDLDLSHVAQFFQGVAEAIYATKLDATKRKGLWALRHKFMSAWLEQFRAFNLTGVFTHGINFISNASYGALEMSVTRALAEAFPGGVGMRKHYGLSTKALLSMTGDLMATAYFGMSQEFPAAHFEALTKARPSTRADLLALGGNKWMDNHGGALPGNYGKVVRTVGFSPLGAMDLLFKLAPYRYNLALQQLKNPGKPVDFKKAVAFAEFGAFQAKLGEAANLLPRAVAAIPELGFMLPYIKTLVNLIKTASMLDPLASTLIHSNDLLGYNGKDERRLAAARLTVSIALAAVVLALYGEGDDDDDNLLNGPGPLDPQKKALWLANHTPLGLKVGNERVSLQRLEPLSGAASLIIAEKEAFGQMTDGEIKKAGLTLLEAWGQLVVGKSFMKGPADALAAVLDPQNKGERYVERTAASIVYASILPNFFSQMGDMTDRLQRDTEDPWRDTPLRRLPVLRERLDPKLGYDGRPLENPRFGSPSPLQLTKDGRDEVASWLLRNDVPLEPMPRGLKRDEATGRRVPLAVRKEILQERKEALRDVAEGAGITREMRKMKMSAAERKELEAEAREEAKEVKGDFSEWIAGARDDAGIVDPDALP